MVRNNKGEIFMMPRKVKVVSDPGHVIHPDGDRHLSIGDTLTFCDAMNGQLYWNCMFNSIQVGSG